MKLKLLTLPFELEAGGFPTDPLQDLPGRAVSVVEHFFQHAGRPWLLLIVHYEESPGQAKPAGRSGAPTPPPTDEVGPQLAVHERPMFERLRAWRKSRAEADAVPPFTLLSNRELVEVVRRRPATLEALKAIHGIGEKKAQSFGADLLEILAALPAEEG